MGIARDVDWEAYSLEREQDEKKDAEDSANTRKEEEND